LMPFNIFLRPSRLHCAFFQFSSNKGGDGEGEPPKKKKMKADRSFLARDRDFFAYIFLVFLNSPWTLEVTSFEVDLQARVGAFLLLLFVYSQLKQSVGNWQSEDGGPHELNTATGACPRARTHPQRRRRVRGCVCGQTNSRSDVLDLSVIFSSGLSRGRRCGVLLPLFASGVAPFHARGGGVKGGSFIFVLRSLHGTSAPCRTSRRRQERTKIQGDRPSACLSACPFCHSTPHSPIPLSIHRVHIFLHASQQ
jgi:hypothetical protein